MRQDKHVFNQIISFLSQYEFNKCVDEFGGDHRTKMLSCWQQFLVMTFGQLGKRESLRDVCICLTAHEKKLYHLELSGVAYALDSTTIELCMVLFPWAKFRTTKAGIKLHTLLDFKGSIPAFIHITDARVSDVKALDVIIFEPGAFYVMDRWYVDFKKLYAIHLAGSFFVTRAKDNTKMHRLYSKLITKEEKKQGLRCDQIVILSKQKARKDYPEKLRRIKYYDAEHDQYYVFLTNNFTLPALVIAELYRYRWRVELFFKWIKQHLKVQSFWGYSENAVKTQIWIAMASYALVAIVKKKLGISKTMNEILQILSISLFDKTALIPLFSARQNKLENYASEK